MIFLPLGASRLSHGDVRKPTSTSSQAPFSAQQGNATSSRAKIHLPRGLSQVMPAMQFIIKKKPLPYPSERRIGKKSQFAGQNKKGDPTVS